MSSKNTLVIYDSQYGNTGKVAQAMNSLALDVHKVTLSDIQAAELIIVGSPTQGGQPTKEIQHFLTNLPTDALKNKKAAAFDTRLEASKQGFGLKLLMKMIDYAAPKILKLLAHKGASILVPSEGFFVIGKSGPVKPGELQRAVVWAKKLAGSL